MNNYATTIAAISTPPGKGGVAIIRISGTDALALASRVFRPVSGKAFEATKPRVQTRGNIYYGEEMIDDGMAVYFKAPASYTGEDTVEIYCHGGMLVTRTVLEATLAAGAVPAEAGEFTRRAFLNGKISLTDAEAIGSLLEAESREQIKIFSPGSRSLLTERLTRIRGEITSVLSSIYARIDYPDEDLGDLTDSETLDMLINIRSDLSSLMATYQTGKAINEGIVTVICGKPNVGKSSVYNLLLGRDAAIVTDIEGTTRDVLSDKIPLGRVMLDLSDTAGVRKNTSDPIEKIGIERSLDKIAEADLILAVFDTSRPFDSEDRALLDGLRERQCAKIALLNKCDLDSKFDRGELSGIFDLTLDISADKGRDEAIGALSTAVDSLFCDEKISVGCEAIIATARQNASLTRAYESLTLAIDAYKLGISTDAASSDVERALGAIAELDGKAISDEIVSDIFSKFCVGK